MLTEMQPGHEYTKGNVKFAITVAQTDAIKKLEEFASKNKETQGKFTIGDEKVRFSISRGNGLSMPSG